MSLSVLQCTGSLRFSTIQNAANHYFGHFSSNVFCFMFVTSGSRHSSFFAARNRQTTPSSCKLEMEILICRSTWFNRCTAKYSVSSEKLNASCVVMEKGGTAILHTESELVKDSHHSDNKSLAK